MSEDGSIFDFFREGVDFAGLSHYLDSLDVATATAQCLKLKLRHQRALFEAAKGKHPLTFADLVPPDTAVGAQVIHAGRNTAILFSNFQKRFVRLAADGPVCGYNQQTFMCVTGPGYFTAGIGEDGQIMLDSRQVPVSAPANWPKPRPASKAIFPFVYLNLIDVLRGVSRRVVIGRPTYIGKKPPDSYFVLIRQ